MDKLSRVLAYPPFVLHDVLDKLVFLLANPLWSFVASRNIMSLIPQIKTGYGLPMDPGRSAGVSGVYHLAKNHFNPVRIHNEVG